MKRFVPVPLAVSLLALLQFSAAAGVVTNGALSGGSPRVSHSARYALRGSLGLPIAGDRSQRARMSTPAAPAATVLSVADPALPVAFALSPARPNPFRDTSTIQYSVPRPCHVALAVYDVAGRELLTLVDADRQPGSYSQALCGADLTSGVFFCRMRTRDYDRSVRLLVLR